MEFGNRKQQIDTIPRFGQRQHNPFKFPVSDVLAKVRTASPPGWPAFTHQVDQVAVELQPLLATETFPELPALETSARGLLDEGASVEQLKLPWPPSNLDKHHSIDNTPGNISAHRVELIQVGPHSRPTDRVVVVHDLRDIRMSMMLLYRGDNYPRAPTLSQYAQPT